jgi:glycosyltransferase involved in cell wall biosynthesis
MHLLIDGQALQTTSSRQRGIGRYSSNLLRALAIARPGWRIEVVQNSALTPITGDDRNGLPIHSFRPPLRLRGEQCELNERYYADWLTARGADGVLILSPSEGWEAVVPSFHGPRPRVFGIAYDLIPLLFPEHYLRERRTGNWFAHRFRQMLNSDVLLAISAATARDIRASGGSDAPQVVNIGGAVDPLFAPLSPGELNARAGYLCKHFGLHREFLLYVGATDYRKNLHGAMSAFAALPSESRTTHDLAVVCRMNPAEQASVMATARQAGIASELRLICSVTDEELRALYQMCRLFFFPSLYEGLGLPVLEALHCGAPVVTSDCSSLPQYAGPCSWLGDPTSPQGMARLLQKALAEPRDARRPEREAFARTFRWDTTAERACTVMERMVKKPSSPDRLHRRLAWVMPLSATTRGMAEYAAELLPFLNERFDIELIAASEAIDPPETLSGQHLILTAQEVTVRHAARPYDLFVYQWSPPPDNRDMVCLLARFPGLLVMSDFSPAALRCLVDSKLLPRQEYRDSWKDWKSEDIPLVPVLGVLVHSTEARRQLQRELNVPVVHLARPSSIPTTQRTRSESFAAYTAWIDQAIDSYEQSDGVWRSFALNSLADCRVTARTVIDSWAKLRTRAWQFADGRSCGTAG